jgi:hypothetical protein
MRLMFICGLFVGTAIAVPHGVRGVSPTKALFTTLVLGLTAILVYAGTCYPYRIYTRLSVNEKAKFHYDHYSISLNGGSEANATVCP